MLAYPKNLDMSEYTKNENKTTTFTNWVTRVAKYREIRESVSSTKYDTIDV